MRLALVTMLAMPFLTACGEAEKAAPQVPVAAKAVVASPVVTAAPADLEAACRDVVNRMFGQQGDAVTYKATGEAQAEVSWRAPVDGGVLNFECRADSDRVGLFHDGRLMSVDVPMTAPAAKQEAR